jgi:4-hydroxy-4-methyl-2-oxoglutarate aldolase
VTSVPPVNAKVGSFVPERVASVETDAPDRALVLRLETVGGLSAAAADALDRRGFRLTVAAAQVPPLGDGQAVVGRALTLRYLPARKEVSAREPLGRLAHRTAYDLASAGDILVISAPASIDASVMGGEALAAAQTAGIAAIVVDGAVRDIDELLAVGVPVWAHRRTPLTGRGRIDAAEINGPVEIAGVQVVPGDVVFADASGITFVPAELFVEIADEILGTTPA